MKRTRMTHHISPTHAYMGGTAGSLSPVKKRKACHVCLMQFVMNKVDFIVHTAKLNPKGDFKSALSNLLAVGGRNTKSSLLSIVNHVASKTYLHGMSVLVTVRISWIGRFMFKAKAWRDRNLSSQFKVEIKIVQVILVITMIIGKMWNYLPIYL